MTYMNSMITSKSIFALFDISDLFFQLIYRFYYNEVQ